MTPILANTRTEIEQSRVLINTVLSEAQFVLRKDIDLIPKDKVDAELSGNSKKLIILRHQTEVIGTVLLTHGEGDQGNLADIRYLTVHKRLRGKDFGKQLIQEAERVARDEGVKATIMLSTVYHPDHKQEALMNWYLKQGYHDFLDISPTPEQMLAFKPEFRERVIFKFFEKNLV